MKMLLFIFCFLAATPLHAQDETTRVDFASQVAPILKKHCAGCHNDEDQEGDFNVNDLSKFHGEKDASPVVKPGDGSASHMIQLMRGTEEPIMPPEDESERVPESEIAIVEQWIDEGAKASGGPMKAELAIESPKWKTKSESSPSILAADWSPDGTLIATAQFGNVKLHNATTLDVKHEFDSLPGKVNSVQFSADGKMLIAATGITGVGGRAIIWDVETRKEMYQLDGHSDVMYDAVISPNAKLAATSAYDKTILLWDLATGDQLRKLKGHNGAVYDLDFSPDSKNLVSASGDQTIKVWNVATGQRLDTLGQPLKEQFVATMSPNGEMIVGGGRDNRLRIWKLASTDSPATNPILFSRFAHQGSIIRLKFSADGKRLFSSAEDRKIKIWETDSFLQVAIIDDQPEVCSAMAISHDAKRIFLGRLDGSSELIDVPAAENSVASLEQAVAIEAHKNDTAKVESVMEIEPNDDPARSQAISLPVEVDGVIQKNDASPDADLYRFTANAGQSLMFEVRAQDESQLDSRIEILNPDGTPVPQVVLRAVRDSYFTFRGKDSDTIDDFRVHNWQEMKLNEYIYANGEVNKLFLHPRGPDSGFRVYPGSGKRFGYFGTTAMSHALQSPCYIVEPWPPGTTFVPNGLPVFELNYDNDDDSRRELGKDSRLKFVAPQDGDFLVRVTDVRGFGGDGYKYRLTIRESNPDFEIEFSGEKNAYIGSGREFRLKAKRKDGFQGPIQVEINNVPAGYFVTSPLTIEANHVEAVGSIHALADAKAITKELAEAIVFRARAEIVGVDVVKSFGGFGELKMEETEPKVMFQIVQNDADALPSEQDFDQPIVFEIRPGESIEAHVVAKRNKHAGPIKFGNEGSGRNLPHGVSVDDLGLNGLMIPRGHDRQRFFIKAEPFVKPQTRIFHLKVDNVDQLVCPPVILKVLPALKDQLTGK